MIKISENLLLICVSQFRWRGLLVAATYKRFVVFFYWYLFKLIIETRGKINTIWTIYRSVVFFPQQPLAKIPFQQNKIPYKSDKIYTSLSKIFLIQGSILQGERSKHTVPASGILTIKQETWKRKNQKNILDTELWNPINCHREPDVHN